MPEKPMLALRLLDPPQRLLTGHRHPLSALLHNTTGERWSATCASRFTGLLLQDGPHGPAANPPGWQTLTGLQFDLDAGEHVELPGDVETRGPYQGDSAPLLPRGWYWLVVHFNIHLEHADGRGQTVLISSPATPLQVVTHRPPTL